MRKRKYIIAYLDVLGIRSSLQGDEGDIFRKLKEPINFAKECCKNFTVRSNSLKSIKVRIFSDNLLFYYKLDSDKQKQSDEAWDFLFFIMCVYSDFLENKGLFLRGFITIGDLYIDKNIILGKSLAYSYEMESKKMFYGRIGLDFNFDYWKNLLPSEERQLIDIDLDGQLVLKLSPEEPGMCTPSYFTNVKDILERMFIEESDIKVLSKIIMFILRFNKESHIPKAKIDINDLVAQKNEKRKIL